MAVFSFLWAVITTIPRAMEHDAELDAVGLLCPLPVLKLRKRLAGLGDGQVIRVVTDDPAAVVDVPHFCAEAGHQLLEATMGSKSQIYLIRKQS